MKMTLHWLKCLHVCAATVVLSSACLAAPESSRQLVRDAQKALLTGQYEDALTLYDQARARLPDNAAIPYNMAVAAYRNGEFDKAAELLKQAISLTNDPKLKFKSTYNLGNASYAQSLKALRGQADPNQAAAQMKDARAHLKEALEHFKKAIDADPADEDAKINAELASRLLAELDKLPQQQMQSQQQSQDQNQDQRNNEQNQQQQQEQQQEQGSKQQQGEQSQPPEDSQGADSTNQKQHQPAGSDGQAGQQQSADSNSQDLRENHESNEVRQEQAQIESAQQERQNPAKEGDRVAQTRKQPASEDDKEKTGRKQLMTKEEADRLLQIVRDKERKRRLELAKREALKRTAAAKDW